MGRAKVVPDAASQIVMELPTGWVPCAWCGAPCFVDAQAAEEMLAEARMYFGPLVARPEDRVVVCDDCWHDAMHPEGGLPA